MINISNKLNTQYVNSNKVNFKGKPQKIFNTAAETLQRTVEDFEKRKNWLLLMEVQEMTVSAIHIKHLWQKLHIIKINFRNWKLHILNCQKI